MDGIAAVQSRIAEIRTRFAPPGATFQAVAARAAASADAATAARPSDVPERVVTSPPAGSVEPMTSASSGTHGTGRADGAWVDRLPEHGQRWSGAIEDAARRNDLDPALLASLVWAESNFDADAGSHAGAIGLAQLMPGTAAGLGVDPYDPLENLDGGARYLRAQLDRFGSPELALAAYNAGPGRVSQAGGVPNIAETQAYVPRVLDYYARLTR